jgi:hypothetical protein
MMMLGIVGSVQAALVHHWELDGDYTDSSSSGNHGTLTGTASFVNGVSYWKDSSDQAFSFDGSTKIEDLAASNLPLAGTGSYSANSPAWTINVFVKEVLPSPDYEAVGGFGGNDTPKENRDLMLKWGKPYLYNNQDNIQAGSFIDDGEWHMITVYCDIYEPSPNYSEIVFYIDGVYSNSGGGASASADVTGDDVFLGVAARTHTGATMIVDGFQIYNHQLSQTEMNDLMNRIPEPVTIALLGLGGLVLLRRRK